MTPTRDERGKHAMPWNKVVISRKRLEEKVVAALNGEVLKPDVLEVVYERTAKKIKEHFSHVPEELRLKKIELNRAETRVHNFIGSSPPGGRRLGSPTRSRRPRSR